MPDPHEDNVFNVIVILCHVTQVIELCPDARLLASLRDCNKLLEMVQKGLSDYLEAKRGAFPRWARYG